MQVMHPQPSKTKAIGKPQRSVRLTVSFPQADYNEISTFAEQMDVSASWVVRKAVEKWLQDRSPLFRRDLLE